MRAGWRSPRSALPALVLAAAVLTGCGDRESTASGEGVDVTRDVEVATELVQRHAALLRMADLTLARPVDAEVSALADGLRADLGPQVEELADWFDQFGTEVPETVNDHANGHADVDELDLPGAEDVHALEEAPDADFEADWVERTLAQHEAALALVQEVVDDDVETDEEFDLGAVVEPSVAGLEDRIGQLEALAG